MVIETDNEILDEVGKMADIVSDAIKRTAEKMLKREVFRNTFIKNKEEREHLPWIILYAICDEMFNQWQSPLKQKTKQKHLLECALDKLIESAIYYPKDYFKEMITKLSQDIDNL